MHPAHEKANNRTAKQCNGGGVLNTERHSTDGEGRSAERGQELLALFSIRVGVSDNRSLDRKSEAFDLRRLRLDVFSLLCCPLSLC